MHYIATSMEKSDFTALLKSEERYSKEIASLVERFPYSSLLHTLNLQKGASDKQLQKAALYKKDPLLFAQRISGKAKRIKQHDSTVTEQAPAEVSGKEEVINASPVSTSLGAQSPIMKAKAENERKAQAKLREQKLKKEKAEKDKVAAEELRIKEEKQKAEAQAKAEQEAKAKAKAEQEAKEKQEAEAKAKAEHEAKEQQEAEAKAKAEQEAKEKEEAQAKAEIEAENRRLQEAKEKLATNKEQQKVTEAQPKEDILEIINELPDENPIKKKSIFEAHLTDTPEATAVQPPKDVKTEDPKDLMVMMSFMDWLQHFKAKNEDEVEEERGKRAIRSAWQKEKLAEAMDDDDDEVPEEIFKQAMNSISMSDGLVSEPLAELYAKQGKLDKAAEMYKKLSLLNPEKRPYFATKIKELHLSN